MSATVLKFPQQKRKVKTFPVDTPQFSCLRCQSEDFKLYETGAIHCSGCGSLIRNLSLWQNP